MGIAVPAVTATTMSDQNGDFAFQLEPDVSRSGLARPDLQISLGP